MPKRTPTAYLTNGKQHYCWECSCNLEPRNANFEMKPGAGSKSITVNENLLICPRCKRLYVTQEICKELTRKHPGYYIDVSTYNIKKRKKKTTQKEEPDSSPDKVKSPNQTPSYPAEADSFTTQTVSAKLNQEQELVPNHLNRALNAEVYFASTVSYNSNVCPICSSALGKELVNIPVIELNGNLFRYYAKKVNYCYQCRKAFITKRIIASILDTVNSSTNKVRSIKLENVTIKRSHNQEYLFAPTLDNSYSISIHGIGSQRSNALTSSSLELNSQSFLGKMGYSVSEPLHVRREILKKAVAIYGKRKVADHIAFLIDTRLSQLGGKQKYANAINIWQNDLNYISTL